MDGVAAGEDNSKLLPNVPMGILSAMLGGIPPLELGAVYDLATGPNGPMSRRLKLTFEAHFRNTTIANLPMMCHKEPSHRPGPGDLLCRSENLKREIW